MVRFPNADGGAHDENGLCIVDEKQPLNNGTADRAYIIRNADQTDHIHVPRTDIEKPPIFQKSSKRKYRTYDTGKRNHKAASLTPLTASGIGIEERLKMKTGLTRAGLILAILCVLLTIVLFVLCVILLLKSTTGEKVCVKPSCLRLSAEMLPKISLNENPCSNFRGFACGNWFAKRPLPRYHTEWNLKAIMLRNYLQEVHELLMKRPRLRDLTITKKMKIFYESCMEDRTAWEDHRNMEVDEDVLDYLKTKIDKLDGWIPYDRTISPTWDVFSVLETMLREYNISPFYQVEVGPDPINTTQNVIYLKPPVLSLDDPSQYTLKEKSMYEQKIAHLTSYIRDILQYLGATRPDASWYSTEIVSYEESLAKLIVIGKKNRTQPRYSRMKVRDLDREFHPLQFYQILAATFSALSSNVTVIVENPGYFSELKSSLVATSSRLLNTYTIWRFVSEYIPYLSAGFAEAHHLYKTELTDKHERMPRWEFCTSMMQKSAGFYFLALHENQTLIAEKEKIHSVVNQIFSETLSAIRRNLKQKNFRIEQIYTDKLSQVKIQIGLPPEMLKSYYTDIYYDDITVSSKDFRENIKSAQRHGNLISRRRLTQPKEEDKWLDEMISMPIAISYNAASNYIIVPWPVLQQPYFEKDYPLASLYGGIGVEIAKALIRSLLPNTTEEESNNYVQEVSQCVLGRNFTNLNLTDTTEFVVTLAAVKLSYEAFKGELSSIEEIHQPGMESYRNEELFFLSYVQSICSARTDKLAIMAQLSSNVNDYSLAILGLLELPEFTELYECNQSSKYLSSQCIL